MSSTTNKTIVRDMSRVAHSPLVAFILALCVVDVRPSTAPPREDCDCPSLRFDSHTANDPRRPPTTPNIHPQTARLKAGRRRESIKLTPTGRSIYTAHARHSRHSRDTQQDSAMPATQTVWMGVKLSTTNLTTARLTLTHVATLVKHLSCYILLLFHCHPSLHCCTPHPSLAPLLHLHPSSLVSADHPLHPLPCLKPMRARGTASFLLRAARMRRPGSSTAG